MASSAQNQLHGGATSAPPPTPSSQPSGLLSTAAAADTLSSLLHRLPPALSLPTTGRRTAAAPQTATCPPLASLSDDEETLLLSSSSHCQLGFFQLAGHSVPSRVADSAESEALSLFDLSRGEKESRFPGDWPFGFDAGEDGGGGESFCLDSAGLSSSSLPRLSELTRELERVGLRIVELLSGSVGFENPIKDGPSGLCTMTWLSEDGPRKKEMCSGGLYPYIVGLQYQIRTRKYSLLGDSGWVSVLPQVDSVLVTIGDIAQVWSNGRIKKVRGRPIAWSEDNSRCLSITVLITLPLDTTVCPLIPQYSKTLTPSCPMNHEKGLEMINEEEEEEKAISSDEEVNNSNIKAGYDMRKREKRLFNSFSFEDYAWRVYNERLSLKDPLDRYRIKM